MLIDDAIIPDHPGKMVSLSLKEVIVPSVLKYSGFKRLSRNNLYFEC